MPSGVSFSAASIMTVFPDGRPAPRSLLMTVSSSFSLAGNLTPAGKKSDAARIAPQPARFGMARPAQHAVAIDNAEFAAANAEHCIAWSRQRFARRHGVLERDLRRQFVFRTAMRTERRIRARHSIPHHS